MITLNFPCPQGDCTWWRKAGRKSCQFMLCICVNSLVLSINGQGFSASSSIRLHSAVWLLVSSSTYKTFLPFRTFTFFFPALLLLSGTISSFWEPFLNALALISGCEPHGFPHLKCACVEAQHMISLLTVLFHVGGFRTSYLCLVKVLPKFTASKSVPVAASK